MGWNRQAFGQLPATELYIFEAPLPGRLEDDKRFLGEHLEVKNKYTFNMAGMAPTQLRSGGQVQVVDSNNFRRRLRSQRLWSRSNRAQFARCIGTST